MEVVYQKATAKTVNTSFGTKSKATWPCIQKFLSVQG